jgi:hypothetical protein
MDRAPHTSCNQNHWPRVNAGRPPLLPQVRGELERRLGVAVRQRHLAKLLRMLEVEVQGGAQPSAAAVARGAGTSSRGLGSGAL